MPRKLARMTVWVALGLLGAAAPAPGQATKPLSDYERLDESRLAGALKDLQMTELLEALLARSAKAQDAEVKYLLAQSKIASAMRTGDEAQRNKLLDEAIAIQDELLRLTAGAATAKQVLQHYRYGIDRAITEGISKVHAYVERMEYFLARPDDPARVAELTAGALKVLTALTARMQMTRDDWERDEEKLVTGEAFRLEELVKEARYRGAWIRFYRAIALPKGAEPKGSERNSLLNQAIEDVREWADAEDNASGVKFTSLLLSGMAARELGEFDNAASRLKRACDKEAGGLRLKAAFELAHCLIEQGRFDEADKYIDGEFAALGREAMGEIATDMQASLLKSHLLEARAQSVRAKDPAQADRLGEESVTRLLAFVEKHPKYTEAFIEVIAPKYEGRDQTRLTPAIQLALGIWHLNRKGDGGVEKADNLFRLAGENPGAAPDVQAQALWYRGVIASQKRDNRVAARFFCELARKHPKYPRAKDAALNAVKSLNWILQERKVEPRDLGKDFVEQYADALKVLVEGWGQTDPKVRLQYYDLGLQYETLGRAEEAIKAYAQVPSDSDLSVHSQYRILDLRLQELLDKPPAENVDRRQLAQSLVGDLRNYRDRAKEYVKRAPPERARQVMTWAARVHLLEAQLYKDVLGDPNQAVAVAQAAAKDWAAVPNIENVCQEFIVRVLLEAGKTDEAIRILQQLKGADELVKETVRQIRLRIERLEIQPDEESRRLLGQYRQAYRVFAGRMYDAAKGKNLPAEQMYFYEQLQAGALESGSEEEAARALEIYERLDKAKPDEAANVRGLARCYRRLGKVAEAVKQYKRLVEGLPEGSADWWRVQLEQLEFFLEARPEGADTLKDVLLQVKVLRDFKGGLLGGFWKQFAAIEAKANELLKSSPPTQPGR